jgi:hypothetical protein
MRFIRVDQVNPVFSHQSSDFECRRDTATPRIGGMHRDAVVICARCQEGIAHGNQLRRVAARAQSFEEEQSLVLSAAKFAA